MDPVDRGRLQEAFEGARSLLAESEYLIDFCEAVEAVVRHDGRQLQRAMSVILGLEPAIRRLLVERAWPDCFGKSEWHPAVIKILNSDERFRALSSSKRSPRDWSLSTLIRAAVVTADSTPKVDQALVAALGETWRDRLAIAETEMQILRNDLAHRSDELGGGSAFGEPAAQQLACLCQAITLLDDCHTTLEGRSEL